MALWPRKTKPNEQPASAPLAATTARPAQQSQPAAPPAPPVTVQEPPAQPSPVLAPAQPQAAVPAGEPGAALTAQEAQKRAIASKHLMASFGEIVAVLMRSPPSRSMPLAEVEGLVMPAIMTGQFLVAEAQSKSNGFLTPIAAALWAQVSPEVDRRLSENLDQPVRLTANEWKSGPIPWMIAVIGDQRVIRPMLKQLQETTLKGRPLKMRVKGSEGKTIVGTFASAPDTSASPAMPQ